MFETEMSLPLQLTPRQENEISLFTTKISSQMEDHLNTSLTETDDYEGTSVPVSLLKETLILLGIVTTLSKGDHHMLQAGAPGRIIKLLIPQLDENPVFHHENLDEIDWNEPVECKDGTKTLTEIIETFNDDLRSVLKSHYTIH